MALTFPRARSIRKRVHPIQQIPPIPFPLEDGILAILRRAIASKLSSRWLAEICLGQNNTTTLTAGHRTILAGRCPFSPISFDFHFSPTFALNATTSALPR